MPRQQVKEPVIIQEFVGGRELYEKQFYRNKVFNAATLSFQDASNSDISIDEEIDVDSSVNDGLDVSEDNQYVIGALRHEAFDTCIQEKSPGKTGCDVGLKYSTSNDEPDCNMKEMQANNTGTSASDNSSNGETVVRFNVLFNRKFSTNEGNEIEKFDDEDVFQTEDEMIETVPDLIESNLYRNDKSNHRFVDENQSQSWCPETSRDNIIPLQEYALQIDFMARHLASKEEIIETLMKGLDGEEKRTRAQVEMIDELKQRNKELLLLMEHQEIDLKEYSKAILEKDKEISSLEEVLKSERALKRLLNHSQNELRKNSFEEREELVQKIQVLESKISQLKNELRNDKIKNYKCLGSGKHSANDAGSCNDFDSRSEKHAVTQESTNEVETHIQQMELMDNIMKLVIENDALKNELEDVKDESSSYIEELRKEMTKLKGDFIESRNENSVLEMEVTNLNKVIRDFQRPKKNNRLSTNIKNVSKNVNELIFKLDTPGSIRKLTAPRKSNSNDIDCVDDMVRLAAVTEFESTDVDHQCDEKDERHIFSLETNTDHLNEMEPTPRLHFLLQLEQEQNAELNGKLQEALKLYDDIFDQMDALKLECEKFQEENKTLKNEMQSFVSAIEKLETSKENLNTDVKEQLVNIQENEMKLLSEIQHCSRCKSLTRDARENLFRIDHILQSANDTTENMASDDQFQDALKTDKNCVKLSETPDFNKTKIRNETENKQDVFETDEHVDDTVYTNSFNSDDNVFLKDGINGQQLIVVDLDTADGNVEKCIVVEDASSDGQHDCVHRGSTRLNSDGVDEKCIGGILTKVGERSVSIVSGENLHCAQNENAITDSDMNRFFLSNDHNDIIAELEHKYIFKRRITEEKNNTDGTNENKKVNLPGDNYFKLSCFFFVITLVYSIYLVRLYASPAHVLSLLLLSVIIIALMLRDRASSENIQKIIAEELVSVQEKLQSMKETSNRHIEFSELYSIMEKQEDVLEKQKMALNVFEKQLKRERRKRKQSESVMKANFKEEEEQIIDNGSIENFGDQNIKEKLRDSVRTKFENQIVLVMVICVCVTIFLASFFIDASAIFTAPLIIIALTVTFFCCSENDNDLINSPSDNNESLALSSAITIFMYLTISYTTVHDGLIIFLLKLSLSICSGVTSHLCLRSQSVKRTLEDKIFQERAKNEELNLLLEETKKDLDFKTKTLDLKEAAEMLNDIPVFKREDIDSISILIDQLDIEKKENHGMVEDMKETQADMIRGIQLLKRLNEKVKSLTKENFVQEDLNRTLKRELLDEQVKLILHKEGTKKKESINNLSTQDKLKVSSSEEEQHFISVASDTSIREDINDKIIENKMTYSESTDSETDSVDLFLPDSSWNKEELANYKRHVAMIQRETPDVDEILIAKLGKAMIPDCRPRKYRKSNIKSKKVKTERKSESDTSDKEEEEKENVRSCEVDADDIDVVDEELRNELEEDAVVQDEFDQILSKVINVQQSVTHEVEHLQNHYERDQQEKMMLQHQVDQLSCSMSTMREHLVVERELHRLSSEDKIDESKQKDVDDVDGRFLQADTQSIRSQISCYIDNIHELEEHLQNEKRIRIRMIEDYENELDTLENILVRKFKKMNRFITEVEKSIKEGRFEEFEILKNKATHVMDDNKSANVSVASSTTVQRVTDGFYGTENVHKLKKKEREEDADILMQPDHENEEQVQNETERLKKHIQDLLVEVNTLKKYDTSRKETNTAYTIQRSSDGYGTCEDINKDDLVPVSTGEENTCWFSIEYEAPILAKSYKLRHGWMTNDNSLRHWVFEGSNDKNTWNLLNIHVNDTSMNGRYSEHIWDLQDNTQRYKVYRIRMTSSNSSGKKELYINAFKVFGTN